MQSGNDLQVSIIIKALNEERRIAACIESAIDALRALDGEVILADSGSTDRTLEIASKYPIAIVQLADPSQRRCGIGPQLGYQFAGGRYIYILDGDMELESGFLEAALQVFNSEPGIGGVAGLVEEESQGSVQFRGRKSRNLEGTAGDCRWLDMGGLYHKEALADVGYMSNRNLFANEEQELGLRLTARGWRVKRLAVKSVSHHGHTEATLPLLRKRWKSGYSYGAGQILRSSIGKPYFPEVLKVQRHLLVTLGLWALLIAGILLLPVTASVLLVWVVALALLILQRLIRYRSFKDALLFVLVWHVNAIGLLKGFFLRQVDPATPVDARVVLDNRP